MRDKIRCTACRRWLFVALGPFRIEIKCKCGKIQVLSHAPAVVPPAPVQPS